MDTEKLDILPPSISTTWKIRREKLDDEGVPTATSLAQIAVEETVETVYSKILEKCKLDPDWPEVNRFNHIEYLMSCLSTIPQSYENLDCGRAWLCYWITHSLSLLNHQIVDPIRTHIINFLERCQSEEGGYGGGPGQYPHLAPTYAAVNALCILGSHEALKSINRKQLLNFLWKVRVGDGSFRMHVGGEIDIRGVYCALSVAKLTNIYNEKLFESSAEWVARCQTYEGGFSSIPGMEAHGGYSFCGIASLSILNAQHLCDLKVLHRWTINKQMKYEGGFQGRTNKLVDGCYSFWQGATMAIVLMLLLGETDPSCLSQCDSWLFNSSALQEYILICCQDSRGGLADKPKVPSDCYHTCYALSGLSVAQHLPMGNLEVLGSNENLLVPVNPVYNLGVEIVMNAKEYFSQLKKDPTGET